MAAATALHICCSESVCVSVCRRTVNPWRTVHFNQNRMFNSALNVTSIWFYKTVHNIAPRRRAVHCNAKYDVLCEREICLLACLPAIDWTKHAIEQTNQKYDRRPAKYCVCVCIALHLNQFELQFYQCSSQGILQRIFQKSERDLDFSWAPLLSDNKVLEEVCKIHICAKPKIYDLGYWYALSCMKCVACVNHFCEGC